MALSISDNTGNNIDHGNGSSLNDLTVGTVAFWIKHADTNTTFRTLINKIYTPSFPAGWSVFRNATTGYIRFDFQKSSTYLRIAPNSILQGTTEYSFWAFTWSASGVDADQKGYFGDESTLVSEISYSAQQVGTGTYNSDASKTLSVGTNPTSNDSIDGDWAWVGIWNAQLTLTDLLLQWKNLQAPIVKRSNNVLFCHYGIHGSGGVGSQLDWSGNANNGTITGATKADHAPLPIFTSYPTSFYKARLGKGYQRDWGLGLNGIVTSADKVEHVPLPIFVTKGMQPTPITVADLNVAVTSSNPDYQGTGVKVD